MIRSFGRVHTFDATHPVKATINWSGHLDQPFMCQILRFQVHPNNTGIVSIGLNQYSQSSPAIDKWQIVGVLAVPVSATNGPFAYLDFGAANIPAGLNAAAFSIIGATGNSVYVTAFGQ